ncbi:MAG: hypothetical protein JJ892_08385 [Balneola sp.]|nr:hypothetical protein [Balneola sp.]MBO6800281.1 hypothetical protein [Balneola sp.]MBO6869705.1 hypothetical protein [Balneola sp.]
MFLVLIFTGCATHAPMSEMTMFNVKRSSAEDSVAKYSNFGIGLQYSQIGPTEEGYDKKSEQDYAGNDEFEIEDLAISIYAIDEDKFGFGYSLGRASGLDFTTRIRSDFYGTVSLSMSRSASIILQQRFIANKKGGLSSGFYFSRGVRQYFSDCRDCFQIGPDESENLFHTGIRSRFLIRDQDLKKSGFTGSLEVGYVFEIDEPYLGFSVAFMTF